MTKVKYVILALLFATLAHADFNQGWNGDQTISDPADPDSWSAAFVLTQMVSGSAIFREVHGNTLVAINASTLGQVHPGLALAALRSFSRGHVGCLKFFKKTQATDSHGFPTDLYAFSAAKCPGDK